MILWSYFVECLQVLVRSTHIVTGIAWIGASFYFVWLDNHLEKPTEKDLQAKGVDGALWAVHGGGFYNPQKYLVAPKDLPQNLHWFYWESYSTWLSGFALLTLTYLYQAKGMLYDPSRFTEITPGVMSLSVLMVFVLAWLIYDGICRLFEGRPEIVAVLTVILIVAMAVLNDWLYTPRAAYLVTGAAIATLMSANVFFVIIPGQRKVVELMRRGEVVDPIYGQRGKQRSVHNTYFTLPVIFAMLSNHFGMFLNSPWRLVELLLMMAAGVLVRRFFVLRHKGQHRWVLVLASVLLVGMAFLLASPFIESSHASASDGVHAQSVSNVEIQAIIARRCVGCHSERPTLIGMTPKGLSLEDLQTIQSKRQLIFEQVVVTKVMPLGNITQMTDYERKVIETWALEGSGK